MCVLIAKTQINTFLVNEILNYWTDIFQNICPLIHVIGSIPLTAYTLFYV